MIPEITWREKLAESICKISHEGQERKLGGPYYEHPMAVRDFTNQLFLDEWTDTDREDLRIVCLLHDVLEDTSFPEELIKNTFGDNVYNGVLAMTRGKTQSKEDYWNQIQKGPPAVRIAKSLDILHNLSTLPVFIIPVIKKVKPSEIKWTTKFVDDKTNMLSILDVSPVYVAFKSGLSIRHVLETQLNAVKSLIAVRETQRNL